MAMLTPSRSTPSPVLSAARTPRYCSGHASFSRKSREAGVELVISHGRASHLVRKVRGPVYLIGASNQCDLVLGDSSFPPVHSYLFLTDEGVKLRHLGPEPEVRVNGHVVETARLVTGDDIDLGPFQFQIRIYQ